MKQRITLLLLLISVGLSAQTVFVKPGSLGLNNGTSWLNAYASIDLALSAATVGQEIWVAAGTYKPTGIAPNNSFYVPSGVKLYGGFAGTESALSQRNVVANATVLSGDILGNDIPGNFTQNRSDNAQHVVVGFVLTANNGLTIDGFTITGGQTLVGTANTDVTRRGGGILLNAKGTISNCTFTGNYGESGAALAILDAQTDGVLVENCLFEANNAVEDAVCFVRNTPTGSIKNCIFRNNNTKRGCLYPANTTNFLIDGCLFESNRAVSTTATKFFGAGMFTWQATFTLSNSIFRKNKADNAAGMYIDGRDGGDLATIRGCLFELDTVTDFGGAGIYAWQATMDIHTTTFKANFGPNACGMYADGREFDSSFSIDSCTFDANVATSYGCSSIWNAQTNFTISNTTFKNNIAPSSGPALYNSENCEFTVSDCIFDGNKANFAGAVANYGINCVGTYLGCTFKNNVATGGGGAASNGFKANVSYVDCEFNANTAASGGGVFTQNDTTQVTIADCYFTGNIASGAGGCVSIASNVPATITGSTFFANEGDFGGAISANGDSLLTIDKCQFIENVAATQAGAINLSHANCKITNTLFARNINVSANAGGGISNNAAAGETSILSAVNCTFADNIAAIGAGIAQWEETGGELATAQTTLLNCLFQNVDYDNYGIEAGEPEVFSLNGNQSGDATLSTYLTQSKDLHGVVNEFQDVNTDNYAHTLASPASDGGVSAGAPTDDILGVSRAGVPDVGYREVKTTGINNPGVQVLALQCVPNPVVDQTTLTLQNDRNGRVQITIWNQLGQQVAQYSTEKTANEFRYTVNVSQYTAGTYTVQVRLGAIVHEGLFVKF